MTHNTTKTSRYSIFDDIKDDNERIIWVEKPQFVPYIFSEFLDWGTVILVLICFGIALFAKTSGSYIGWIFAAALLGKSLYNLIYRTLSYTNTYYGYSDKRVLIRNGFIGIDYKIVDYDKILDTQVTVSVVEKLYGVGTIKFFSGNVKTNSDDITKRIYEKWEAIPNPYLVFKKVKTVTVDIKTDYNFPNALRPDVNPGYDTKYIK